MTVKITTLSENTASRGNLLAEWGLSVLVETGDGSILFDTGQSISVVHNAEILNVNLSRIGMIVLSHGHYDHTGGLAEILKKIGHEVDVVAHQDIWQEKYARDSDETYRRIGIPFKREELEEMGARFKLTGEPFYVQRHVITTGEIPMTTEYEEVEANLLVREGEGFRLDILADDLGLIIDTELGSVVVLGCAHRGLINTLYHVRKLTHGRPVYAVLGGTHLLNASEYRIEKTTADLKEIGVRKLGVSHCTGFQATVRLAQEFGEDFFLNNAGTRITLP